MVVRERRVREAGTEQGRDKTGTEALPSRGLQAAELETKALQFN